VRVGFFAAHDVDAQGKPAGGVTVGRGFTIAWQRGPLGRGAERKEPNGAFVEDVIDAARDRLMHYQRGEFACEANADALRCLTAALEALDQRTRDRETRGVEGTHAQ